MTELAEKIVKILKERDPIPVEALVELLPKENIRDIEVTCEKLVRTGILARLKGFHKKQKGASIWNLDKQTYTCYTLKKKRKDFFGKDTDYFKYSPTSSSSPHSVKDLKHIRKKIFSFLQKPTIPPLPTPVIDKELGIHTTSSNCFSLAEKNILVRIMGFYLYSGKEPYPYLRRPWYICYTTPNKVKKYLGKKTKHFVYSKKVGAK